MYQPSIFILFQLWDGDSGEELTVFDYGSPGDTILCVNLSKDGRRLIASATSGLVVVSQHAINDYIGRNSVLIQVFPKAVGLVVSLNIAILKLQHYLFSVNLVINRSPFYTK